jgi:hypothetical protein
VISRRAAILGFCAAFFGGQLVLVTWSYFRGDRLGGYQMFAETTFFTARLQRVTADGRREHAPMGNWRARDAAGGLRTYRWGAFVDDFRLDRLENPTRAKIGIDVTLKFFQYALDHVAKSIPDDRETARLEMVVRYETASGKRHEVTLSSAARPEAVAP